MFSPGDIVGVYSHEAGKHKFHLCIGVNGHYVFVNSPKAIVRPADLYVDNSELPGLMPTATGKSIICCNLVMQKTDAELRSSGAVRKGTCEVALLRKIIKFVEACYVLSEEEKSTVVDGLAEWI
jgi:hypothetical protein